MEKKLTMKDRVLRQMKDTGNITTWEAIQVLGCTRLSEYIRQLRENGYDVRDKWLESKNRYSEPVRYKLYYLVEEN
jgi:hypothetical protein